jgi:TonB family protein
MQKASLLRRHGFWVSLLAHLLLWSSFSFVWLSQIEENDKLPSMYIPSYIANTAEITRPPSQPMVAKPSESPVEQKPLEAKKETSKQGIEKPAASKAQTKVKQSASAAQQYQSISSPALAEQGVHLIGDEKIEKDLRVILGKAISAHLFYPKAAIQFNVRGTVLVGFTLYPDGRVTDVQLVKPSPAGILNTAALSAIRDISPVDGVAEYIQAPRFLVVGIIFG